MDISLPEELLELENVVSENWKQNLSLFVSEKKNDFVWFGRARVSRLLRMREKQGTSFDARTTVGA